MQPPCVIHLRRSPAPIACALLLTVAACSGDQPTGGAVATEPGSAPASPSAADSASLGSAELVPLEPGGLSAGTRYFVEGLGLSFQPEQEGWFAVLPAGGDIAISREDVTIYALAPDTVLSGDGPPTEAPSDPEAFLDLIDATPIVNVSAVTPFEAGGLTGLSAELEAAGGGADRPLLTTGTGEFGLLDGEFQWIVFEVDGRPVVLSIEKAQPDVDAAWEIAGALIESVEATP